MLMNFRKLALLGVFVFCTFFFVTSAWAQSSGTITGVVKDATGGVLTNASVEISDVVSGYHRDTTTGNAGDFRFTNVPFNTYHLVVKAPGFSNYTQDVDVRSSVPATVDINLKVGTTSENITVEATGADLVETESTPHTDVDRELFDKLPLESESSSLSSLVTLASPGVVADSNGLFHGLGDHAENSFSVDGQPITDQQSKVFSNQLPVDAVESLEVIQGAPPAEYGGKTSLVIVATTRSGLDNTEPHGSVTTSYGTNGSANAGFDLAYGGKNWGNFISANGLNTGRFLDGPEHQTLHDHGNEENFFDRIDFKPSQPDSLNLNLGFTRSWFQTPNSYDTQTASAWSGLVVDNGGLGPDGQPVGSADQRSKIRTFNIAPTWTRLLSPTAVLTFGGYVRQDQFNYYPSRDPYADFAPDLQSTSIGQNRRLTNAGVRASLSYVKGIHNLKAGVVFQHTFLTENDTFGIVDPGLNPPCLNADGSPDTDTTVTNPSQCTGSLQQNSGFVPLLAAYDLRSEEHTSELQSLRHLVCRLLLEKK